MLRQDVLVVCSTNAHIPIITSDLKGTLGAEHFILRGRGWGSGGGGGGGGGEGWVTAAAL